MKFIIDRTTWLRGEGSSGSVLYRDEDAKQCCLGQVAYQCGIGYDFLAERAGPMDTDEEFYLKWPEPLRPLRKPNPEECRLSIQLMLANDSESLTEELRESKLIALCAPHGIELEFIN